MKRQLPMESSSLAVRVLDRMHGGKGLVDGGHTRMKRWLENGDLVTLSAIVFRFQVDTELTLSFYSWRILC